jgi:GT2 family glycosyltransferase
MNNLTVISCSYNTPQVTEVMLKSFIKVHGDGPFNFLLAENSTNDETKNILDEAGINYIDNPGGTHHSGVQLLLDACKTKYALLVDTDIVFKSNIKSLLTAMEQNDITMLGEVCGSRGGYNLHPRVHPWFCLINVENIKKHNIKFTDMVRVKATGSDGFYNNIPINQRPNDGTFLYDVGATFYEDIIKANLKVANIPNLNKWFVHYEGSSWQRISGHQGFENLGNSVWQRFQKEIVEHKDIDIKGKLNVEPGKKYLFVYPVFIPDDKRLEEAIESIGSWVSQINQETTDIIIGGWCANDEYYNSFVTVVQELDNNLKVKRFDKNYGKAKVVNDLVSEHINNNPNCEYFISCDSDIVLPLGNTEIFERMDKAANIMETQYSKKFSYFALEQLGACCHQHEKFDSKLKLDIEDVVYNSKIEGIAGGAIFVSVKFWKEVGGYRVMGVYSGDDGYLLYDSFRTGHTASVIKTISVFHPGDSTTEYTEWKKSQLSMCTGRPVDNLDGAIANADAFWSSNV